MFGDGTQRLSLPRYQIEEMQILDISFSRVGIEPTACRAYSHTLEALASNVYILVVNNPYPDLEYPPPGHIVKNVAQAAAKIMDIMGMYSAYWQSLSRPNNVRDVSKTSRWVSFTVMSN